MGIVPSCASPRTVHAVPGALGFVDRRNARPAQPQICTCCAYIVAPQTAGIGLLLDLHRHRHLLVQRADDEVLAGLRELALEAVVRGRGLRVEALEALR